MRPRREVFGGRHAEERKRAIGAVGPISNVINNNKETNVNSISSVGVLICPRDAEPGGTDMPAPQTRCRYHSVCAFVLCRLDYGTATALWQSSESL